MNLSQDEINALTGEGSPEDAADDSSADIMSPEAIAAMLEDSAGAAQEAQESAAGDDSADSADILSPEAIAAMLDESAGGADAGAGAEDAQAAAGNGNGGTGNGDELNSAEKDDLDDLFARLDDDSAGADESGAAGADSANAQDDASTQTPFSGLQPKEGMLTPEEIDVLGEVGNISMGAVATTMYSLLDKRVSITTPRVNVYAANEVLSIYQIPFVVATIEYVEGISGNNLLVLRIEDAALITDILMGGDGTVEQPIELNEMHLSAMSEIMNQMMGASSTSLSKLLRKPVNISPPRSTQVDAGFDVSSLLGDEELVTKVSFDMEIEGLLKSELIQLIPYEVSRGFAKMFLDIGMGMSPGEGDEAAQKPAPAPAPAAPPPQPQAAPQPQSAVQPQQSAGSQPAQPAAAYPPAGAPAAQYPAGAYPQEQYPQGYPQAAQPYPPGAYPPAAYPPPYPSQGVTPGRLVDVHPMQFQPFDSNNPVGEHSGMDLIYNIPLQVTVELGKTKKEISEILEFSMGTVVVLDKIAGDPVEVVVNGKLIARGEVVVIDDSYGVRITDIISGQ